MQLRQKHTSLNSTWVLFSLCLCLVQVMSGLYQVYQNTEHLTMEEYLEIPRSNFDAPY